ncbi:MAG: WD40 repeat domain-containing protein [Proteobacteria bacterium]|nr:WD40 repeat domain-containing protein [Pseudomonadota bacterium]
MAPIVSRFPGRDASSPVASIEPDLAHPEVTDAAFAPDGHTLITTSAATTRFWEVATGHERFHTAGAGTVAVSPDGRVVALGSTDYAVRGVGVVSTIRVLSATTGAELRVVELPDYPPQRLRFEPDGRLGVSAHFGCYAVSDLAAPHERPSQVHETICNPDVVVPLVRAPVTKRPPEPAAWPTSAPARIGGIARSQDQTRLAVYLPELAHVLVRHGDAELALADELVGERVDLAFLSNERLIVAAPPRALTIYSTSTGQVLEHLDGLHHDRVATSPDGRLLVAWGFETGIQLWDLTTGAQLHARAGHRATITSSAASPDGRRIATTSLDGTAKLWDARTGAELFTIGGLEHPSSIAFSPDGTQIAVSAYQQIQLWDARGTLLQQTTPIGGSGTNDQVAFSPDGTTLAYWSRLEHDEAGQPNGKAVPGVGPIWKLALWDLRTHTTVEVRVGRGADPLPWLAADNNAVCRIGASTSRTSDAPCRPR